MPHRRLRSLFGNRRGATSIEYAIMASVIAVVLVAVIELLGDTNESQWNAISEAFQNTSGNKN